MTGRALIVFCVLALAAILLDQWVKHAIETAIPLHGRVDILPFLALHRTHNTGIAFSMLSGIGDTTLIALVLAVTVLVIVLALRTGSKQHFARFGFALIVGGAVGNLIDRLAYGYVIDYVLFHTPVWSFAIFNLADAFITVGAGFVILDEFLVWRRERAASRR